MYLNKIDERLVILGLDGMSREILFYGVEKGYMPTLKKLISKGMVLRDMDCIPPLTLPSWTSIMTGVNPGKHGIFDFFKYRIVSENKWIAELVSANELEHPRIHETIGLLNGKTRMFLLNIIPGYPLIPFRNAEILQMGFFAPKILSSPLNILDEYRDYIDAANKIKFYKSVECEALKRGRELLEVYHGIIEKALRKNYDFYWFATPFPDSILHKCNIAAKKLSMLNKIYSEIDKIIKDITLSIGNLIIVSDHGFKYYRGRIYVNRILYEESFITKPPSSKESGSVDTVSKSTDTKMFHVRGTLYKIASSKLLRPLSRALLRIARKLFSKFGYNLVLEYETGIDFTRSKAFIPADKATAPPRFYIVLNDNNPETINKLKMILRKYNIVVKQPQEVFEGPYVNRAPGLIIIPGPSDDKAILSGTIYSQKISNRGIATHSRYGIFGAYFEDNVFNLDLLPNPVPNTIPAPIALLFLGYPISHLTDHIELLEKIAGNVRTVNVVGRWRMYKKLYALRTKMLKQ
ncbi:type I phosphodiesterase/nucleotide pyrophosphatase [Staphylothermus marinus F1]|uniref:Type I phosphodiesterase/nucleotide pyrophosphatase n=1 Tax=Staphylothermus marinus (strain ATCC 43588 / DSM 3639 / JCM 9404 / F1) TaxID=399550 RepID=A3DN37_STAMF|nr:alkaline phosphatase family protein [Staphylothermus marinus]ABN70047.1 type I phosphodiesterase/nucleotide pyrophosphatase [Staphylothermus marinus F1]